jgi:hypothetical protein
MQYRLNVFELNLCKFYVTLIVTRDQVFTDSDFWINEPCLCIKWHADSEKESAEKKLVHVLLSLNFDASCKIAMALADYKITWSRRLQKVGCFHNVMAVCLK